MTEFFVLKSTDKIFNDVPPELYAHVPVLTNMRDVILAAPSYKDATAANMQLHNKINEIARMLGMNGSSGVSKMRSHR